MKLKKLFTIGLVCAALLTVLAVSASAHGGRHHSRGAAVSYPVCTVEGCAETGRHLHDGTAYCGYDHADGICSGSECAGGGHHGGHC